MMERRWPTQIYDLPPKSSASLDCRLHVIIVPRTRASKITSVKTTMSTVMEKIVGGPLKEGSKLPTNIHLKEINAEKDTVDLASLPGRNIIVGVPGAFTPACSSQVPGFVNMAKQFIEKGVDSIYVIAVNDQFTMQAWKDYLKAEKAPAVHFLADDTNTFTKKAGMDFDATGLLGGRRSQRYVAIVEGGVVVRVFVEDEAPSVTVTSAENVLKALQ
ncbi:hypothetical protein B0A50_04452 [Salinomyces thailandicus]|uniref:Thioredoxin domain-containing protein n=1 Tax=Salinomyces thailandicus TaxID=706561 RepID=A0A4U0TYL1_9PEZI|nr:hypothetical protein B0A50_04452 [Salinomyces thailandica]